MTANQPQPQWHHRGLGWSYCNMNGLLWESVRVWACMMQIKRSRAATGNLFPITTSRAVCAHAKLGHCLSWLLVWIQKQKSANAALHDMSAAFCLALVGEGGWVGGRHSIGWSNRTGSDAWMASYCGNFEKEKLRNGRKEAAAGGGAEKCCLGTDINPALINCY